MDDSKFTNIPIQVIPGFTGWALVTLPKNVFITEKDGHYFLYQDGKLIEEYWYTFEYITQDGMMTMTAVRHSRRPSEGEG